MMYPNERAKLAAEQFINRAREPRNEGEIWRLTAAQIERQEQGTADDFAYAIRWTRRSYPACLNPDSPCQQGDKLCPTPIECRLPERRERRESDGRIDGEAAKLIGWFLAALVVLAVFSFASIKWG